mmetsp:Transcript_22987/g.74906  ORF Transcript_22987/g.74906 Transcript_22987/m.74906 type:complete len:281 (-) Transcript_22987:60-902(-)
MAGAGVRSSEAGVGRRRGRSSGGGGESAQPRRRQPPRKPATIVPFSERAAQVERRRRELVRLSGALVVEGPSDARAARAAVAAPRVVRLGGAKVLERTSGDVELAKGALGALREACEECGDLVVLTDPDVAGLAFRNRIEAAVPGAPFAHAFVPRALATATASQAANSRHEAGDPGVEYAGAQAIAAAVRGARRYDASRVEFDADDLVEWGLAGEHGKPPPEHWKPWGGVMRRRIGLGHKLGFGCGNAKVFLRTLNRYGFTREEIEAALDTLPLRARDGS